MARQYRALISVPIGAEGDDAAYEIAVAHAHSLLHPGSDVIAGHLELLGEVAEGSMTIRRVVEEDSGFRGQLPSP